MGLLVVDADKHTPKSRGHIIHVHDLYKDIALVLKHAEHMSRGCSLFEEDEVPLHWFMRSLTIEFEHLEAGRVVERSGSSEGIEYIQHISKPGLFFRVLCAGSWIMPIREISWIW